MGAPEGQQEDWGITNKEAAARTTVYQRLGGMCTAGHGLAHRKELRDKESPFSHVQ